MSFSDKIKDFGNNIKNSANRINNDLIKLKPYSTIGYVALFIAVIALFITFFSKKNGNLKPILTAYTVFTLIFAICSLFSIIIDLLALDGTINYGYVASFVINIILGMITLFMIGKMALFITLIVLFFIALIFLITLTNTSKSDKETVDTMNKEGVFDEFVKFCQINLTTDWNDISKVKTIFNYGWSDKLSRLLAWICWGIWLIICIVLIPLMLIIWSGNGIYQLFNNALGKVSTASSPSSATGTTGGPINVKVSDTLHWVGILCLFMLVIFVLFASQSAMRKNPIATFGMGIVAAIGILGYLKFTDAGSFSKSFLGVIVALFVLYLYLYNPYNIFEKMSGINLFAIFLIFFGILGMIYVTNSPDDKPASNQPPGSKTMKQMFSENYMKLLKGVTGLIVSIGFIMFLVASIGTLQSSDNKPSASIYILNTLIVIGFLTIAFNVLDAKYKIRDNVGFKLLVEIILYIPCLLSDFADLLMTEYYKAKYFTLILVVLEIIFIIFYWFLYEKLVSKVYTGGGKVLINSPVSLNKQTTVGYYRSLSGVDDDDAFEKSTVNGKPMNDASGNLIIQQTRVNTYKFGISCWIYLNPMPSLGAAPITILDYGSNPTLSYSPQKNELTVNVVEPNATCATSDMTTISVYTNKNPPLQKWFNLVLNYDGGHLDIFLDSVLVQTSTSVVSCVKYDALVIGDKNNLLNARMCNLIYFKTPLDIITVHNMYNITKIEDTPDIPKRDLFSI